MEICLKLPVYECKPNDWVVGMSNSTFKTASSLSLTATNLNTVITGTTATPAVGLLKKYARRVAFKRDASNQLVSGPVLIGISGTDQDGTSTVPYSTSGTITEYPLSKIYANKTIDRPRLANNALWFKTDTSTNAQLIQSTSNTQEPLIPVLQIQAPYSLIVDGQGGSNNANIINHLLARGHDFQWLQHASDGTRFNAVFAAGDTPARPNEKNGGMYNFVRFIEDWNWNSDSSIPRESASAPFNYPLAYKARISGGFYQVKNSSYATGPFLGFLTDTSGASYTYATNVNNQKGPYYQPPTRQWGYDVGLLAQSPDWFTQKLVKPPDGKPDEFFREVGKDDLWVHTLLCAAKGPSTAYDYALPPDQRPADCPSTGTYSDN
jgi:hypothetical protein